MGKQRELSAGMCFRGVGLVLIAWLCCAPAGAFYEDRSIPLEVEGEGEVERFTLMLGLGAVSPEFIHGHILPDPDAVELCPPLAGQPWCGLYASGAEILLTPVPNEGYVFSHWTGDLSGSAMPGVVTMDADKHVTAEFVLATEGEGETPPEGEPAEGEPSEGESDDDECGCCGRGKAVTPQYAIKRMLGNWLLLGMSMMILVSMAVAGKSS